MVDSIVFSGDAIYAKEVGFPKGISERLEYVQAVRTTVEKVDQFALPWIEQFETTVKEQVGQQRLDKAQRRVEHLSTCYYLWTLTHPNWAVVLNIISIGMLSFFANDGKTHYEASYPLMQLAELLDALKAAIQQRKNAQWQTEETISRMVWGNRISPEELCAQLERLAVLKKEFDETLSAQLKKSLFQFVDDATTYTNEERYQTIHRIYECTKCKKELANLKANKQLFVDSKQWELLQPDVQLDCLKQMAKSDLFESLLSTRIQELAKSLSWNVISTLPQNERQNINRHVSLLRKELAPSSQFHSDISRPYNALLADIKNRVIKECSWSPEDTRRLEVICQELGLSSEFEFARFLHGFTLNELGRLSKEDRQAEFDRAYAFMQDDTRVHAIEIAFDQLRADIQNGPLKVCFSSERDANQIEEICKDLGLTSEFTLARDTNIIEKRWDAETNELRLENTKLLVANETYYKRELERRCDKLIALAKDAENLAFDDWKYVVDMLRTLTPFASKSCEIALGCVNERLLHSMSDKKSREDEQKCTDFAKKAKVLGIDPKIIEDLSANGPFHALWQRFQTGMWRDARLDRQVITALKEKRVELRRIGCATEIVRIPQDEDLVNLQLTHEHLAVCRPSDIELKGSADIKKLMGYLREADGRGLIPKRLRGLKDNGDPHELDKKLVLDRLSLWLEELAKPDLKSPRLLRVRNILMLYTTQLEERFAACKSDHEKRGMYNERRDIYVEVVELIGKEMGFAYFACEDRKYNVAMQIFNEKIAKDALDDSTTEKKVQLWVAKKRDELVSGMLREMIKNPNEDVASAISKWRYTFRKEFGLGDVPQPQYAGEDGGLTAPMIRARFNELYTAKWILAQAMEEYRKAEKAPVIMTIGSINEFLKSRISNYNDFQYNLLDEDCVNLLDRGMVLYLQEAGIFKPVA